MSYQNGLTYFDQFRIEVREPDGVLPNLVDNPNARFGAWGWRTPVAGTDVYAQVNSGVSELVLDGMTDGAAHLPVMLSTAKPISTSKKARVSFQVRGDTGLYIRGRMEFLDDAGAVVGSTAWAGPFSPGLGTLRTIQSPASLPPSTARFARMRIETARNLAMTTPTSLSSKTAYFRNLMITSSNDPSIDLAVMPYAEAGWIDVTGESTNLQIDRKALDVGILVAKTRDALLDPSRADLIRPGRQTRVLAADPTAFGGWRSVFFGEVQKGEASYDKTKRAGSLVKTNVTLTATDSTQKLANHPESRGVRNSAELPALLETKGVPWLVYGSDNAVENFTVISVNEKASALDQIAITRDSNHDFAYVSAEGVLTITAGEESVPGVYFSDYPGWTQSYSKIDVSFSTEDLINSVIVQALRYTPAVGTEKEKTETIVYGPFQDQLSIEQWGVRQATFTVQGADLDTDAGALAYANAVLLANAQPRVKVKSLEFPVRDAESLAAVHVLELTKTVEVEWEGQNYTPRIGEVHHRITPKGWTCRLSFDQDGTVARPTATPAPAEAVMTFPDTDWITPPLLNGWAHFDGAGAPFQYRRKNGMVIFRGLLTGGGANLDVCILPAGFRGGWVRGNAHFSSIRSDNWMMTRCWSNGAVQPTISGVSAYVDLGQITYLAEQ